MVEFTAKGRDFPHCFDHSLINDAMPEHCVVRKMNDDVVSTALDEDRSHLLDRCPQRWVDPHDNPDLLRSNCARESFDIKVPCVGVHMLNTSERRTVDSDDNCPGLTESWQVRVR